MKRTDSGIWPGIAIANPGTSPRTHLDQNEVVKVAVAINGQLITLSLKSRASGALTTKTVGVGGVVYVDGELYSDFSASASGTWLTYESNPRPEGLLPSDVAGLLTMGLAYDLDGVAFPSTVAIDAIAETAVFTVPSQKVYEITSIRNGPSAALVGAVEAYTDNAETNLIFEKALNAADTEYVVTPFELGPGGQVLVDVTTGGAAGTRLQVSGRRIA